MGEHLSLPIRLPDEQRRAHDRLATLTERVANRVLRNRWATEHLDGIGDADFQAWKYFDDRSPFDELDDNALVDSPESDGFTLYLPSRYRRCILQKVGETLRSQAERRAAFQSIQHILPDHKIRRIHRRRIKEQLWDDSEYLSSGYVDGLIDQLNGHYDRHGEYPVSYFDMQDCPEYSNGTLPYSADDGPASGQAVKYQYDGTDDSLTVKLKTPDTPAPESRGDWSWHEYELDGYGAFHDLATQGDIRSPEFQPGRQKTGGRYHELSFPVEIEHGETSDDVECALTLDAGMRKDMTAVVMDGAGEQRSRPHFVRFTDREKMQRLHTERTRLNDRLAALRRRGHAHTDEFAHIQSEYERVNAKITNKREQLTHDVANQIVALALGHDVDAIVHEDLRSLSPPSGEGTLSWELSSWARKDVIEKVEYRAELAGIKVARVYPADTSRSCPRCGSTGHTCKSPDHTEEVWWGGHFRCDNARCDFEGDRDYVGALNVGRVFFGPGGELDHGFTSSYTGDSEIVPACRSVGTRLVFGTECSPVAYTPESEPARATVGGGSARVAPAVALSESITAGGDGLGPTVHRCTRFQRSATESY